MFRGELGPTKTAKFLDAPPTLPIAPEVVEALKVHRKKTGRIHGFVVCHPDGSAWRDSEAIKPLERALRKAGLPRCGWHRLRHSFATQAVRDGVPLPVLQRLLTHQNVTTTTRYVTVSDADMRRAVNRTKPTAPERKLERKSGADDETA